MRYHQYSATCHIIDYHSNYWGTFIIMKVVPLHALSRASCTKLSEWASRALVASSKIKIFGFFRRALAIATLTMVDDIINDFLFVNVFHLCSPLLLAARKSHAPFSNECSIPTRKLLNKLVGVGQLGRGDDIIVRSRGAAVANVFHDSRTKQHGLLVDVPYDLLSQPGGIERAKSMAIQSDFPVIRLVESLQ